MSLLSELNEIAKQLNIPFSTSVYVGKAPNEYMIFVPLYDTFDLHADNCPGIDVQEARISLFSKGNYTAAKNRIIRALIDADITVTSRKYVGYENDTGYNNYAIDVAKEYGLEEL